MNLIRLSVIWCLVSPILAVSFKCAALDGTTYFDISDLAKAAVKGDKTYFEIPYSYDTYELALCTELKPRCTIGNHDTLVWYTTAGSACEGILTGSTYTVVATYSILL